MTSQVKYQNWVLNKWQPKARELTHLLSRTTNFLLKHNATPETIDGIATNINELREALTNIQMELVDLEKKRVL